MATYYISPTGNDTTGNGSSALPWLTLSKAITSSIANDTIICKNGTYTFSTQTIAGRIIQAENTGLAIFDGTAQTNPVWSLTNTTSLIGLKFQNITHTSNNAVFLCTTGTFTYTFTNCIFYTISLFVATDQNFGLIARSSNTVITDAYVITGCLFDRIVRSSAADGQLFGMRGLSGTFTLTNCTFYLNGSSSTQVARFFTGLNGVFSIVWKNNIIRNVGTTMAYITSGSITHTFNNNCSNGTLTSLASGTGNITSDPLFVDEANSNFALRLTSPCIDTGGLI